MSEFCEKMAQIRTKYDGKATAGQAKYERPYTRKELFELYTCFRDDPDALKKLADFMVVDWRNADAAKLLAEFSAVHDAQSLNLEQRGKGR